MDERILTADEPSEEELAEQARIRREKLQKMSDEGNNPFIKVSYPATENSASVQIGRAHV